MTMPNLPGDRHDKIYLSGDSDCHLTRREAQCVYHLVDLKYRWRVAEHLGLSRRTVDAYVESAKRKIATPTQRELIEYIMDIQFPAKMRRDHDALLL